MNVEDQEVGRRDVVLDGVWGVAPDPGLADGQDVETVVANQVLDWHAFINGAAGIPRTETNIKWSWI
jgi:hypothetical protein